MYGCCGNIFKRSRERPHRGSEPRKIFKKNENPCTCPSNFPVCVCGNVSKGRVATRKPILPSPEELEVNSRSKSAKLRVFERK